MTKTSGTGTRIFAIKLFAIAISATVILLHGVLPAAAQQTDPLEDPSIEEITVTARKRSESQQDVPGTLAAFTSTDLENRNIVDITNLTEAVPNLYVTETGGLGSGILNTSIRGVGAEIGVEQGVAIYIDDIYLNNPIGQLLDVIDLDRIEVLKGPQGTLYGRNTTAGAIKYVTRRPTDHATGYLKAGAGSDGLVRGQLMVSGPIVEETLSGSLMIYGHQRDGFQKDLITGQDYWDKDSSGGRLALSWKVTDSFDLNFTYNRTRDDHNGRAAILAYPGNLRSIITPRSNRLTGELAQYNFGSYDPLPDTVVGQDEDRVASDANLDKQKIEVEWFSLTADWQINDYASIKSSSSWHNVQNNLVFDLDGTANNFIENFDTGESDQFSQEIQINYDTENFNLVTGLFYMDYEVELDPGKPGSTVDETAFGNVLFNVLAGAPPSLSPYVGESLTVRDENTTESYAGYFNLDLNLTHSWTVNLGGRYTKEKKKTIDDTHSVFSIPAGYLVGENTYWFDGTNSNASSALEAAFGSNGTYGCVFPNGFTPVQYLPVGIGNCSALLPPEISNESADDDWTNFSAKFGITYSSDDWIAYGYFAEGFRAGGFDGDPLIGYDPEEVTTYALGFKSTLADGRIRLNVEAFLNEIDDLQYGSVTVGSVIVDNYGEAESKGVDLDMAWLISRDLQLDLGVGYLDSEIKEAVVDGVEVSDNLRVTRAPKWSLSSTLTYDLPLGNFGNLRSLVSLAYKDDTPVTAGPFDRTASGIEQAIREEHVIWNARMIYSPAEANWQVSAWVKNIADKRVVSDGYLINPLIFVGYNEPRTFGISAEYRWD